MLPCFSGPRQTCFRQVIEFLCMAWLPRNFIQSDVSIHVTCNNLIYCKSGLKLGGKTRDMFSSHFAAVPKQVTHSCCPFHRSLRLHRNRKPRIKSLRHQGHLDTYEPENAAWKAFTLMLSIWGINDTLISLKNTCSLVIKLPNKNDTSSEPKFNGHVDDKTWKFRPKRFNKTLQNNLLNN